MIKNGNSIELRKIFLFLNFFKNLKVKFSSYFIFDTLPIEVQKDLFSSFYSHNLHFLERFELHANNNLINWDLTYPCYIFERRRVSVSTQFTKKLLIVKVKKFLNEIWFEFFLRKIFWDFISPKNFESWEINLIWNFIISEQPTLKIDWRVKKKPLDFLWDSDFS